MRINASGIIKNSYLRTCWEWNCYDNGTLTVENIEISVMYNYTYTWENGHLTLFTEHNNRRIRALDGSALEDVRHLLTLAISQKLVEEVLRDF